MQVDGHGIVADHMLHRCYTPLPRSVDFPAAHRTTGVGKIYRAIEQGCDTLITCGGLQSNHCRATAILGAQLGLNVHLILRDEGSLDGADKAFEAARPEGNLFLDYLAGAEVSRYDKKEFQGNLPALFEYWTQYYQAQGNKVYSIPTGASDGTGVWGYVHCIPELISDFEIAGIKPETIIHATGSGGTQAGLSAGATLYNLDAAVLGIAVCDNADYFQNKVRADLVDWQHLYSIPLDPQAIPVQVDDDFIGPGYARANEVVFATIRELAALEGLILDPVYTGKAFHGMTEKIKQGEFDGQSDIVFVHTGGIFGLFAQGALVKLQTSQAH